MNYVLLVTLLILFQYFYFMMKAGAARGKGDVAAPAITGDENYERCNRVQMNTLEQLVLTLPALWICALHFRADVAAVAGLVFLIGRFIYAAAYVKDPKSRGLGMGIGFLATVVLLLGSSYAVIMSLL